MVLFLLELMELSSRRFNVEDGTGAAFAYLASIPVVLISGRESEATINKSERTKNRALFPREP